MLKKTPLAGGGYKVEMHFDEKPYHANGQPYRNRFPRNDLTVVMNGTPDARMAKIAYKKQPGGLYIYSNNPEMLAPEDVGQALLRTRGLSGSCMFTYEHSNYTGAPFYLGYQLLNESSEDAVITVSNIGMQVDGEWLGQRSWCDYFNHRFELPADYFLESGEVNPIYVGCDYQDYTPRVMQPLTVTLPAGAYFYVLGGTSEDAHDHLNIGGTADRPVNPKRCANGAVKFSVDSGCVTGTFYCYTEKAQVQAKPPEQGYIVDRIHSVTGQKISYYKQYEGWDKTTGLIEGELTFLVDDDTPAGRLPVCYSNMRDPDYVDKKGPYAPYAVKPHIVTGTAWANAYNPNRNPDAVGNDMIVFNCIDVSGNPVAIDNEHADGGGDVPNTGNWMVQYTDNITLVNAGSQARHFRLFKRGNKGVLFTMVRDEDGTIRQAKALTAPYSFASEKEIFEGVDRSLLVEKDGCLYFRAADGRPYCDLIDEHSEVYALTVPPLEAVRFSVDYLILGNSCGGVNHWIEVE